MIQKNVLYHAELMQNVALVAQARMIPLSQLHDQIINGWLTTAIADAAEPPGSGPDMVGVYMQEETYERLLTHIKNSSTKITYSDVIRSALARWLKTMKLEAPLNPTEGNG